MNTSGKRPQYVRKYPPYNKLLCDGVGLRAVKVFWKIENLLKYDCMNRVFYKQGEIGKKIGLDQPAFSRGQKELEKCGIIKKLKGGCMINPHMLFIGSESQRVAAVFQWEKLGKLGRN